MKKEIVLSIHIFLITTLTCFSQSNQELIGGFESNTKYVYGYSEDFRENIYLGITFGNTISSFDTTYYIKFQISVPETDFRSDIKIRKSSAIKIIAANEQSVDLELADVESSINTDKLTDDPFAPTQS